MAESHLALLALLGSLLGATLRVATPLILCALAGLVSERAGVIDIGLEGKMLLAACAAGSAGVALGSTAAALALAIAVAVAASWLHGLACVAHRGDQVVSGVAINLIAAGLTVVLASAWFGLGGQTPPLADAVRLHGLGQTAADALAAAWPGPGRLLGAALLGHNALVYLALALVPALWWALFRTRTGLRLRAVGENPAMVDAAGVWVPRLRWLALTLNGALCGLAGAYLVLGQNAAFVPQMTAGRGFMALAAMIFGHWHPLRALLACLLFGFLDAAAIRLEGVALPLVGQLPVQAVQALPYLLTVVLLAGFIGRAVAPRALGQPYLKEH